MINATFGSQKKCGSTRTESATKMETVLALGLSKFSPYVRPHSFKVTARNGHTDYQYKIP